jgi:hypothetical protein
MGCLHALREAAPVVVLLVLLSCNHSTQTEYNLYVHVLYTSTDLQR